MTGVSRASRALPLQGSPRNLLLWLIVLGIGVPTLAALASLGHAWAKGAPEGPLILTGALTLAVTFGVSAWIYSMTRRIGVTLDADALTVVTGLGTRRFPLSTLRAAGVRGVNLAEHAELRP